MTAWDELVSAALLGTQRRPVDRAGLPAVVRPLVPGEPEAALLTAAAVLANYRRAGHVPARPGAALPVAARDERPLVPPAARRRLLRMPTELLAEWLQAVQRAGLRVPPERLPALAEAARTSAALRAPLAVVAGPAGSWLGERNPEWAFLVSAVPGATGDEAWEYGNPMQRQQWLDRTLAADPGTARAALTAGWAGQPAAVRAEYLEVLGEHLSPEDEPLLEAALDDRAAQVRESAAQLLARLPSSRLADRMRERAGRLVRRDGDALAVSVPDIADSALLRDVGGARAGSGGWPAGLLRAVVAATPLAHWAPYGTPAELLAAPVAGVDPSDSDALRTGWAIAAGRQGDVEWAAAVLAAYRMTGSGVRRGRAADTTFDDAVFGMVGGLPEPLQPVAVLALAAKVAPEKLAGMVATLPAPWSPALGTALLDWLAARPRSFGLAPAARRVGISVPRASLRHPIATAPVPPDAAPWYRELGATLTFRREMHREIHEELR